MRVRCLRFKYFRRIDIYRLTGLSLQDLLSESFPWGRGRKQGRRPEGRRWEGVGFRGALWTGALGAGAGSVSRELGGSEHLSHAPLLSSLT